MGARFKVLVFSKAKGCVALIVKVICNMSGNVKMFEWCRGFAILAGVVCSVCMVNMQVAQADMKPSFNNEHRSLLKVHRVAPGGETHPRDQGGD